MNKPETQNISRIEPSYSDMEKMKQRITNLSGNGLNLDRLSLKEAKRLIFLPDYSPCKGRLPVGAVAVFDSRTHIPSVEYIGPDIGCGMLLARFKEQPLDNLNYRAYSIACALQLGTGILGSLGGGNHFIDIYEVQESSLSTITAGEHLVLIHSGSRKKGVEAYEGRLKGQEYIKAHNKAVEFATKNRKMLLDIVREATQSDADVLFDRVHNYMEVNNNEVIYRKGANKLNMGDIGIIPSSMVGDAVLIRAKPLLADLEWSINHGTGRKISISDARKMSFDSNEIRKHVYIPHFIYDDSFKTENPEAYKALGDILPIINQYVEIVGRLKPVAFVK